MPSSKVQLNEGSIMEELKGYKDKPYKCIFEYIRNSLDAGATIINIDYDIPSDPIVAIEGVSISDNGSGWDFQNINTSTFLSSTKAARNSSHKTIPHGKFGRGRYVFIWMSQTLKGYSGNKLITLHRNTEYEISESHDTITGTKLDFLGLTPEFSGSLRNVDELKKAIILEFCQFVVQGYHYKIFINGDEIDFRNNIDKDVILEKALLPDDLKERVEDRFILRIIVWKEKPAEFSYSYFLTQNGSELHKEPTGLNKQGDGFNHSVYISSDLYMPAIVMDAEIQRQKDETKRILKQYVKEKLYEIRQPFIDILSDSLIEKLNDEHVIPDLNQFHVYDREGYEALLKAAYKIQPSLFSNANITEKKFVCATFASLVSTEQSDLIILVLQQIAELTDEERQDLFNILTRTRLSNVIATIREIDKRLQVIESLQVLIDEHKQETLEVVHIQKILDSNFWIFGEEFRLFSSTEGQLKKVLYAYAEQILGIKDPTLETESRGELDLFLTKTENYTEDTQRSVVVELKRASICIGKEQFDQIDYYRKEILKNSVCNGDNHYREFYLIGKDYDNDIREKIESSSNYGEKKKGLAFCIPGGRVKIYVRKWSDILLTERGSKMRYLKDKLEMQARGMGSNPDEITEELVDNQEARIPHASISTSFFEQGSTHQSVVSEPAE